jgi:hypothetical protein
MVQGRNPPPISTWLSPVTFWMSVDFPEPVFPSNHKVGKYTDKCLVPDSISGFFDGLKWSSILSKRITNSRLQCIVTSEQAINPLHIYKQPLLPTIPISFSCKVLPTSLLWNEYISGYITDSVCRNRIKGSSNDTAKEWNHFPKIDCTFFTKLCY